MSAVSAPPIGRVEAPHQTHPTIRRQDAPVSGVPRPRPMGRSGFANNVPLPAHKHLPNWVRRAHGQIAPQLGEIMASLHGEPRELIDTKLREMTEQISAGKFSIAWQYPQLLEMAQQLGDRQKTEDASEYASRRGVDMVRRRAEVQLRTIGGGLSPDVLSRLERELRGASDMEGLMSVESQIQELSHSVQTVAQKKRSREIEKTKTRLAKSLPLNYSAVNEPQESWQDVLRRFATEQSSDSGTPS